MNERSIISAPGDEPRRGLADEYLPATTDSHEDSPAFQIDASWIRGALYRQRWLVGLTLLAALILGLVVTLLATPIYQAKSSIRVQPLGLLIVPGTEVNSQITSAAEIERLMQTYQSIVQTRKVARIVAENLDPSARAALLDDDTPIEADDETIAARRMESVAQKLQRNVTAESPVDTQIIEIAYTSEDPTLAAIVANGYSGALVISDSQTKVESNTYAREYLSNQIDIVRDQLNDAERAANAYARDTGIVTTQTTGVAEETGQTITGANLANINQAVATARADRIAAEQKWRAASSTPATQLQAVQSNPVVQNLTAQRAEFVGELSDLRQRYNDDFPAIVDLRARIQSLDEQIAQTAQNIKAGIRNEFVIARNQEAALRGELVSATEDALVEQDENVEFASLERTANGLRAQLTELIERFNQISTLANVQSGTVIPLDSANVPSDPISPDLTRNMLIAVVFGLAIAGGLALIREIFVNQFRRSEDVEDRLGLPVLGVTPYVKSKDIDPQDVDPFSALMESYASIRSAVDVSVPREGAVLQMTSSGPAEGKSTTALILSELFARLGRKTLLIDADLRKPSIVKLLEMKAPKSGIAEVLMGHATFDEAVIRGSHENLDVMSTASSVPNPVELLSSSRFREFIEEQRQKYSLVIIDSSPVLGLADSPEVAQVVDATIFIVEANSTSFNQARTALKRLTNVNANVIGSVLTKYRALEAGVDYDYQYQYYQYGDDTK